MTEFRMCKVGDLTSQEWSVWEQIRRDSAVYTSPYFHPEFIRAVAAVRDDVEIAVMEQDKHAVGFFPFQRERFNVGIPVGSVVNDDTSDPGIRHLSIEVVTGAGQQGIDAADGLAGLVY